MDREQRQEPESQPYSPQPYRPEITRYRAPDEVPAQPAPPPTDVPPEVLRQVTQLSDPGRERNDRYVIQPPPPRPQSLPGHAADTSLAAVSHFAIAFGFVGIGFLLSIAINFGIWLYGKRSPYVAFHAQQAGSYQVFVLLFNVLCIVLILVLIPSPLVWGWNVLFSALGWLMIIPLAIWYVFSIIYGIWGGFRVLAGRDFRYPFFGRSGKRL